MDEKKIKSDFFDQFSGDWMETASKFWENTFKLQNEAMGNMSGFMNYFKKASSKSDTLLNMGNSINKFVVSFFSKPENLEAFTKTSEVLPLLIQNMSHNLTASFNEIQNRILEKSSRLGSEIKELNMEDFNTGIFTVWNELYKSDFQKFYNMPQLGIARNYQEQINSTLETGNRYYLAFAEFMNLLYLPVEKSGSVVMEKYQEMVDHDELPDDPKLIYKLWIKTLEGYYMQMLQSDEYTRILNSLINTTAEHKQAQGKVLQTVLHQLQVPTNNEMDELYKEIYLLKKRVKQLEKEGQAKLKVKPVKKATAPRKTRVQAKPAKKTTAKKTTAKKPAAKKPAAAKKTTAAAKKPAEKITKTKK